MHGILSASSNTRLVSNRYLNIPWEKKGKKEGLSTYLSLCLTQQSETTAKESIFFYQLVSTFLPFLF